MRIELSRHAHQRLVEAFGAAAVEALPTVVEPGPGGERAFILLADEQPLPGGLVAQLLDMAGDWRLCEAAPAAVAARLAAIEAAIAGRPLRACAVRSASLAAAFRTDAPLTGVQDYAAPYFAVSEEPGADPAGSPVLLHDTALFEAAQSLWRDLDRTVWSGQPGAPRVFCRGEGYSFFETGDAVVGRYRYPLLRDGAPMLFLRSRAGAGWTILSRDSGVDAAANDGRVLRALVTQAGFLAGGVAVHAAAFSHRGQGYLICGEKGQGKTTNLTWLLEHLPGADFISNDKVMLLPAPGGGLDLLGSPQSIPVRRNTLAGSRRLADWLGRRAAGSGRGYTIRFDPTPAPALAADRYPVEEVYFTPGEFAEAFGKAIRPALPLAGVIVLAPRGEGGAPWQPLAAGAPRQAVADHRIDFIDGASPFWDALLPHPGRAAPPASPLWDSLAGWRLASNQRLGEAWAGFPPARPSAARAEQPPASHLEGMT